MHTQNNAQGRDGIVPGDPLGNAYRPRGNSAYGGSAGEQPTQTRNAPLTFLQRLFGGKKRKISDNGHFIGKTPFAVVYERRPVPTVNNALAYAYDSMALPATAPVGNAVAVRVRPWIATRPGQFQGNQIPFSQQALVSGLPIVAGQMFGQQLLNPAVPGGYINEPAGNLMPTRNAVL